MINEESRVLLFAGTTEGREISDILRQLNIETFVCVATNSGAEMLEAGGCISVLVGRLTELEIVKLINEKQVSLVIDATHPYAEIVSENIARATKESATKLIRVVREEQEVWQEECVTYFDDIMQLIDWLNESDEKIFSTLGAKEAKALTGVKDFVDRVFLRVLPSIDSLRECLDAGYVASNIICMQPPFSREINEALFKDKGCGIMITKDTGKAGGMQAKMEAAMALDMRIGIISRPKEKLDSNSEMMRMSLSETKQFLVSE